MSFRKYLIGFELLLFLSVLAGTYWELFHPPSFLLNAENGILDLRDWDSEGQPIISLTGEWEFFPGQLFADASSGKALMRSVPDLWTKGEGGGDNGLGAGTYRLTVLLPPGESSLALRWTTISCAAAIAVDGTVIGTSGRPSLIADDEIPLYSPQVASFRPRGEIAVLTVQVSNHRYRSGGFWRDIELGTPAELRKREWMTTAMNLGMMAVILTIALNNLILFFLQKKEFSLLSFSFFTAVMSFRYIATGDYIILRFLPRIPYDGLIKTEYVTLGLGFAAFMLFIGDLFRKPRKLLFLFLFPEFLFTLMTLICPVDFISRLELPFVALMLPLITFVILWALVPAVREKKEDHITMIVLISFLAAAFAHDSLTALFHRTGHSLLPGAFFLFICFLTLMLARRFHRIQKKLAQSDQLVYRATYDQLTGLYNRATFFDFLKQAIAARKKTAVAMIDMDGLKKMNDIFGHHAGDAAIGEIARRLDKACIHRGRDIAGRLGGDEFALMMPLSPRLDSAQKIAEHLQKALCGPFPFESRTHHLEISVGVALFPDDGTTPDDLLKKADMKMYRDKRSKTGYRDKEP